MTLANIEKNDVDLNVLFNYTTEVELTLPNGKDTIKLYQRVIGDEKNNQAQVHALRASGELRAKFKDTKWEDRIAFVPKLDNRYKKEEVVEIILALLNREITIEAVNEVNIPTRKEPDEDSTLEEREEYQTYVDNYPIEFNTAVAELLKKKFIEKRKELGKINKDILIDIYQKSLINTHVQQLFEKEYLLMSTYFGTFRDSKFTVPAYKTFAEFKSAPTQVIDALTTSYKSIEVNSLELKK